MPETAPQAATPKHDGRVLPVQWREFIRFCTELKYGEIERLAIQNGLPVIAELTKKKVRFTPDP